jgi:hypothetical protein
LMFIRGFSGMSASAASRISPKATASEIITDAMYFARPFQPESFRTGCHFPRCERVPTEKSRLFAHSCQWKLLFEGDLSEVSS